MKIKKIVIIGLAAFSLGLSACGGKADPGLPVSKVVVSKVSEPFIVGDTIDLDEYVNVEGGKGAKVYTASAAKGSESRIEFGTGKNAHKVTILEEGTIKINIVAENLETKKSGTFTFSAYTKLKAAFVKSCNGLEYSYAFVGLENEFGEEEVINEYLYHNEEYFYGTYKDSKGSWKCSEGILRYLTSGNTYEFTTDGDFACTGFEVGERLSDISRYSTNQAWLISESDVTTQVDGNGVTFLQVAGSVPSTDDCPYSFPFYSNLAGEISFKYFNDCAEAMKYPSTTTYKTSSIDIYANEDANGNVESLVFNVMCQDGTKEPEIFGSYRLVTGDDAKVPFLESEIKTGAHEPAPISVDKLGEALDAIAAAGNYTTEYVQWWSSDSAGKNVVDLSEDTADQKDKVYSWLENTYEVDFQVDGQGRRASVYSYDDGALLYETGYAKMGDKYVNFGNDWDEATESYLPISSEETDKDTFEQLDKFYSLTCLTSESEDFVVDVSAYAEGSNYVAYQFSNTNAKMDYFLKHIFNTAIGAGFTATRFFEQAFGTPHYDFLDGIIAVYNDGSIVVQAGFCWTTDAYYNVQIKISDIGTTELDLTGIPEPAVL